MAEGHYGRSLWRKHKCRTCHKEFESSRIDAAYCSGRCRVYWARNGAPYPGVGTPEEVGPGLFDEIEKETGMTPKEISAHLEEQGRIVDHMMNPPEVALPKPIKARPKRSNASPRSRKVATKPIGKTKTKAKAQKGAKKNARKK